jgi:hypothetical protein
VSGQDEIPMSHTLQTSDWETLDRLWGVNAPQRHIFVPVAGFQLRKLTAFFGGGGAATPSCVDYGGWGAVVVQTIQVKGEPGQVVQFLQGTGGC